MVGVRPELPVDGVDIISGNDLAVARLWGEQVNSGICGAEPKEVSQSKRMVFTVCAVTHAKAALLADGEAISGTSCEVKRFVFPIPTDLCVSRRELAKERGDDPSLKELYDQVLPASQVKKAKQGYFLQNDLFLRAWAPCGE